MQSNQLGRLVIFAMLIAVVGGLYSCKSSERATRGRAGGKAPDSVSTTRAAGLDLSAYRNTLGDVYASQNHDMPEIFMESYEVEQSGNRNPFDGYRIQVISTRDVELADSIATSFRIWADTTIVGFNPETYQYFKPPHYRVHVGDFQNRERAIDFSRLVKLQYPDAWVVHDRIIPNNVPADTVKIQLKSEVQDTTGSKQ